MERAGVEAVLLDVGAVPGDDVEIAGHVFTFEPASTDDATITEDSDAPS
jgi:hypothetical protein